MRTSLALLFLLSLSTHASTPYDSSLKHKAESDRAAAEAYKQRAIQFRNQGIQKQIYVFARQLNQQVNAESISCEYGKFNSPYIQNCDFTTQSFNCRISYGDSAANIATDGSYVVRRVHLLQCLDGNSREIIRRSPLARVP